MALGVRAGWKLELPLGPHYQYNGFMGKQSTIPVIRKKRGRPATGVDPLVALRFPPDRIEEIDNWAGKHSVSRSEAIRRLVELGLTAKAKK
jgi:hypothetical protein